MDILKIFVGIVLVTILTLSLQSLFPSVSVKYYAEKSDIENLKAKGEELVANAKASNYLGIFISFASYLLTTLKLLFSTIVRGLPLMISDFFAIFGGEPTVIFLLSGLFIFIIAVVIIKKIAGR